MIRLWKAENYDDMSAMAAGYIMAQVLEKPDCVLGLATGTTPLGTYAGLVEFFRNGLVDFSRTKTVNLDEYVGFPETHAQNYRYFMNKNLFTKINIDLANTFVPNGMASDLAKECASYDQKIAEMGGVDLQLLGIGHDGHIGFNEPDTCFSKGTHKVDLTRMTIQANSRLFEKMEDVPHQALTMGIGTIMSARKILMIVSGKDKKEILKKALFGPVTPQVPASMLQFHPNVVVITDADAYPKD